MYKKKNTRNVIRGSGLKAGKASVAVNAAGDVEGSAGGEMRANESRECAD